MYSHYLQAIAIFMGMSIETVPSANPEWDFGDRLRKVRRSIARMSQHDMAVTIGITQKAYAAWESGLNRPKDIVAVARQIEGLWPGRVTSAWLLGVGGDEPPPTLPPTANVPRRDRPMRRLRPVAEPDGDAVSDEALAYLRLGEPAKAENPTHKSVGEHIDLPNAA